MALPLTSFPMNHYEQERRKATSTSVSWFVVPDWDINHPPCLFTPVLGETDWERPKVQLECDDEE